MMKVIVVVMAMMLTFFCVYVGVWMTHLKLFGFGSCNPNCLKQEFELLAFA